MYFKYLECEVGTGKGDGVEVNGRLQVVGAQHGDTLIESSLFKNRTSCMINQLQIIISLSMKNNLPLSKKKLEALFY